MQRLRFINGRPVGLVSGTQPIWTTPPSIVSFQAGNEASFNPGVVAGTPSPSVSYIYLLNGFLQTIPFTPTNLDIGKTLQLQGVATNINGTSAALSSIVTIFQVDSAPVWTASPTISLAQVGNPVSYTYGTVSGYPSPSVVYSIFLDGVAKTNPYTPVVSDIGKSITVSATATNTSGSSVSVSTGFTVLAAAGYAPNSLLHAEIGAVGPNSIELKWLAPLTDATHDAASDYEVQKANSGTSSWSNITKPSDASTLFNVTGLSSDTSYDFRIRAKNSIGTSGYWNLFSIRTLPASNSYKFQWAQRRLDNGTPVTSDSFIIYGGQVLGGAYTQLASIPNSSLSQSVNMDGEVTYSYVLNGLSSGDWYLTTTTVDSLGNESDFGPEIHKVIA